MWLEIELGRVPQALCWLEFYGIALNAVNLTKEQIERLAEEDAMMDAILAIVVLRTAWADVPKLDRAPAVLETLGLHTSRLAAMFLLGYEAAVKSETGFDEPEAFFAKLLGQPAARDVAERADWGMRWPFSLRTVLFGCRIEVLARDGLSSVLLGETVLAFVESFLATSSMAKGQRLILPGRLQSREDVQARLCTLLGRVMVRGLGYLEDDGCRVEVGEFDVARVAAGWASASGVDKERIAADLARHFGLVNKNTLVYVQPPKSAIVVAVESRVEDRVLRAIHRMLRESSKNQFEGRSPGILCCHLAEVTEEQLAGLREKGEGGIGLDYMTSDLLDRRPNLHSVTYTSQARVREKLESVGLGVRRSVGQTGPAYTIKNANHGMADDERLSAFGEGWPPRSTPEVARGYNCKS